MVTSTLKATQKRRDIALERLVDDDELQYIFRCLRRGQSITHEQFRIFYGEVRAALSSPDSLPMDYTKAAPRDENGDLDSINLNRMDVRGLSGKLAQPHRIMERQLVVRLLCAIRDYHLGD